MLALLLAVAHAAPVQPGDVVFQRSRTEQAEFIARATHAPWTHVGLVLVHDGVLSVVEAGDPVQYTSLAEWAGRSADGRIAVRRHGEGLPDAVVAKLYAAADARIGLRYDARFAWSDDRMYCSELVYKLLRDGGVPMGKPRPFGSFDLSDARVARAVRARWGTPPLDEVVVSPADLFVDPEWSTVCVGAVADCVGGR